VLFVERIHVCYRVDPVFEWCDLSESVRGLLRRCGFLVLLLGIGRCAASEIIWKELLGASYC
jgi:hypothetical protein